MSIKVLLVFFYTPNQDCGALARGLTAAHELSGTLDIALIGQGCDKMLSEISQYAMVSKVYILDHAHLAHHLAEPCTEVLQPMVQSYSHVLFISNTTSKNVMARLAAVCDISPISDVIVVENENQFKRPIYAGNIIETVESTQPHKLISIRESMFLPMDKSSEQTLDTTHLDLQLQSPLVQFESELMTQQDRPDLGSAKIVVSGGRGVGSQDNFNMIYALADCLDAGVGASRAAVDAGYVSNDFQVGQTGKIVAPNVYIAVGISGAIQHMAGMKDSRVIIAINQDEDAPIMQQCDYGLVGDLFSAVPAMIEHFSK
jgi:electron transfer flavoprotein alpha subunit